MTGNRDPCRGRTVSCGLRAKDRTHHRQRRRIAQQQRRGRHLGLTLNGAALTAEGALIGGTDHGTPYIAGSGVYDGSYEVAYRHAGDTEISTDSGAISLVADFGTASLSGAAGDLTISGVISGVTLSGDVTYDGMAGTLTGGVIGANLAAGYFSGIGGGNGFAGGFLTMPATP